MISLPSRLSLAIAAVALMLAALVASPSNASPVRNLPTPSHHRALSSAAAADISKVVKYTRLRNRVYSPELGRFLSRDPIGFDGGWNQYAYVGNNPVGARDPLGLQGPIDPSKAPMVIGAAATALTVVPQIPLLPVVVVAGTATAAVGAAYYGIPALFPDPSTLPAPPPGYLPTIFDPTTGLPSLPDVFNPSSGGPPGGPGDTPRTSRPYLYPYNISSKDLGPAGKLSLLEYALRSNLYLEMVGTQTICPTAGPLRAAANAAKEAERRRAERAGTPYKWAVGHVPDTAISGFAVPPAGWIDIPKNANSAAGGGLSSRAGQRIDIITVDGVVIWPFRH